MITVRLDTAQEFQGKHQANQVLIYPLTSNALRFFRQHEHGVKEQIATEHRKLQRLLPQVQQKSKLGNLNRYDLNNFTRIIDKFAANFAIFTNCIVFSLPKCFSQMFPKFTICKSRSDLKRFWGCKAFGNAGFDRFNGSHNFISCFDKQYIGSLALIVKG